MNNLPVRSPADNYFHGFYLPIHLPTYEHLSLYLWPAGSQEQIPLTYGIVPYVPHVRTCKEAHPVNELTVK